MSNKIIVKKVRIGCNKSYHVVDVDAETLTLNFFVGEFTNIESAIRKANKYKDEKNFNNGLEIIP